MSKELLESAIKKDFLKFQEDFDAEMKRKIMEVIEEKYEESDEDDDEDE